MEELKDFKPVRGYDGMYLVSRAGQIYSKRTNRFLSPSVNEKGYLTVEFRKNRKRKREKLHRVVAMEFVENPFLNKEVNHKDGNKNNNNAENLEWCTRSENLKHAYKMGLKKPCYGKRKSK